MEQIIQLAPNDDITSIRSRLEWSDARRLLLVVPRKNKTLQSLVKMKILARTANTLNLEVALVTKDLKTRDAAKQAKVKTYPSEWFARRGGFISKVAGKPEPEKTIAPQLRLVESPTPRRIRIKDKKLVVVVGSNRINFLQQLIALVLAGALALVLVVLVLALSPAATITLTPQVDTISTELTVIADPNMEAGAIDPETNRIPARPVQVELNIFTEVGTIDTEKAPVDFATGSVVMFNRTQDEQIVPIGATVRTSSGVPIEFITTQTATIPAGTGAITTVGVIAVKPGPSGNVPSGQINRFSNPTAGLLVRVINDVAVTGGSLREAGVVSEDDKDRVRSKLRQLIQQQGYEQMLTELDAQEFVPPESLLVIELNLTYDKFSGDVSETLGAEMQAVVRGTAVGNYNANQLAYFSLLDEVPEGYTLLSKGLTFSAGGIEDVADRTVTFPVTVQGIIVADIEADEARSAITFMPIGEAQGWLSDNLPIIGVPGIDVLPNWLGRMPLFPFRIEVLVNDVLPLIFGDETS